MNELALFAGAGGGILGGHILGWRTVCAVEWEPYAASVLAARQNDGLLPAFPIWMTFAPLMDDLGRALLTWFLAAFRARTSAWPARGPVLTAPDPACGVTWRASLARFDPDTSSWRTAQRSFFGDSDESSVIWPRSGMTAGGQCWELPMSEHRISGTGSGLWPTPTVCGNYNRKGASASSGDGLATAVRMWPTPNSGNDKWGGTMQEWGGSKNWVRKEMPDLATGALNPTWVEWLMGWPIGWTDLQHLEMDRFRQWLHSHGMS